MNNSGEVMKFALGQQENSEVVAFGYDKDFDLLIDAQKMASVILEKSKKADIVEMWGYSLGAKVLVFVLRELRAYPEIMGKISVKLIAPYFGPGSLKPEQNRVLKFGAIAPIWLGSAIDFFGKKSDKAIIEAIRKDFESLEDPAYDFTTYSEVCSKIYKERNFSKIIAECKAMVGEVSPLLTKVPVHTFITKRDEFMDWNKQVEETKRIFGKSAKIQFVDSTHCGFPFEKNWTSAIQHII